MREQILGKRGVKAVFLDSGRDNINYYADWKNVRLVILEPYWSPGKSLGDPPALTWLQKALDTPAGIEHVFVAFHRPHFPLNPRTDPFWSLLLKHNDKIRAVFNGHIHKYSRERFPDEPGGLLCINAGSSGAKSHNDGCQTVVEIRIDGPKILLRTIQTPSGLKKFELKEQYRPYSALSGNAAMGGSMRSFSFSSDEPSHMPALASIGEYLAEKANVPSDRGTAVSF
jgi:hypothetical protein